MHSRVATFKDTIFACATGPGAGALAIVRLAGPEALEIGQRIAPSAKTRQSHRLELTKIVDENQGLLDEGMVVEMHAPRSYTGEDIVEFHLHGAPIIVERLSATLRAHGARLAQPGEYTLRAYVNGKLDLAQAEAVADLIAARSDSELRLAGAQLNGSFSNDLNMLIDGMEGVLRDWQAVLDFPEYPSGDGLVAGHRKTLEDISCRIQEKITKARIDVLRGREIVLCGAPNVGKSTLLNALAGERRVLVDKDPGTTRDPVRVEFAQDSQRWALWDTAGIREGSSELEQQGIELSFDRIKRADLALWLLAADNPVFPPENLPVRLAVSKSDLLAEKELANLVEKIKSKDLHFVGAFSAQTGTGLDNLAEALNSYNALEEGECDGIVVRERHLELLKMADSSLSQLLQAYDGGQSLDVLAMDLQESIEYMGQILGRDVKVEILDQIFSHFCIGK